MNLFNRLKRIFWPSRELSATLSNMFDINIGSVKLYEEALLHRSISDGANNERLEYLGDAVLDLIVADILYTDFPELNEGELTKLKSKIVSRENFRDLAIKMEMPTKLPIKKQHDLDAEKIIGNVLEALFGAMYYDQGYAITKDRASKMIKENCSMSDMIATMVDPKSSLLEWAQKHKRKLRFVMNEVGNGAVPRFEASIMLDNSLLYSAQGPSKKKAQMAAAAKALSMVVTTD